MQRPAAGRAALLSASGLPAVHQAQPALALLLHAGRQHRVNVLQVHLLASLTQAHELLSEARDPLTKTRRLLLRTKPSLNAGESELRGLKPEVACRLYTGHAKLAALQCALLSKLLGAQTQAAACFCCTRRRTGADLSKLASKLCTLHGTIGRRLKACCTKLCRGARLLLKDVALQLLLGNRLPRATKGTGLHGLSTNLLLCELDPDGRCPPVLAALRLLRTGS
jgi:hypothetical protein